MEPTGAPKPLEKQKVRLSQYSPYLIEPGSVRIECQILAPSTWNFNSLDLEISDKVWICSNGIILPPDAKCVFSVANTFIKGLLILDSFIVSKRFSKS